MNRADILIAVKGILKKSDYYFLQNSVEAIDEETRVNEDLLMDSIQIMEFIVDIESFFGVRFDFSKIDAGNIQAISEIINMIVSEMQES